MLPGARAVAPRQSGIEDDGDAARQADLAAMGMAAQHEPESGMGRLAIDLRRVGEKDGEGAMGDLLAGALDVVYAIEPGIVDACEMDRLLAAANHFGLVQQHADSHRLQPG